MAWLDWFDVCAAPHERTFAHDCRLSSLPNESDRELAALWRAETDIFNGAYLQFLANWGRESYVYASQALKKIGAHQKADIVDRCQTLVDEHFDCEGKSADELRCLVPNAVLGSDGKSIKEAGSVLPEPVVARIYDLSYEFMNHPEDVEQLAIRYYRSRLPEIEQWVDEVKQGNVCPKCRCSNSWKGGACGECHYRIA
jgi:hypothetical protein